MNLCLKYFDFTLYDYWICAFSDKEASLQPVVIPRERFKAEKKLEMKVQKFYFLWQLWQAGIFTEEADTDLETDRLLGQQRTDDQGFYDDKVRYNCMRRVKYADEVQVMFFEGALIELRC